MTYIESAALMTDAEFRGRIKVGSLTVADYYLTEPASTPGHSSRYKWAQQCFLSPDATAAQLQPGVVMDAAVQSAGAEITDVALQASVEAVIGKII